MVDGAGEVLARFEGLAAGGGTTLGTMFWSWERILGNKRGPCVRITGDRDGVVLAVVAVETTDSGGDELTE